MSDARLPRNARDIIDRLGPAVTLRLIRTLGGTTIPVPMRLTPVGEARYRRLCDMIGEDVAKALCREYAGTNLYIPTCRQAAADERAKEVAKVASHTRPDGTNCFTVLKEYGVSDTATGENAAWGETTPEKVVADWMASEGHRVNIMDPAAKYMCLGYNYDANSQWGHNWIQIFAK